MLSDTLPVVMCRNEERFIERVLWPLWQVWPTVLVGDTGSTDDTLPILRRLRDEGHVELFAYEQLSMKAVGQVRKWLAEAARARGARYAFMVDADEIYSLAALRHCYEEGVPDGTTLGFTAGMLIDEDPDGSFYELKPEVGLTGRTTIFLPEDSWHGEHPFESMGAFEDGKYHHYFSVPAGYRFHHVHLHRLVRSSKDGEIPHRVGKRKQFSMMDKPGDWRGPAFDLDAWCAGDLATENTENTEKTGTGTELHELDELGKAEGGGDG